MLIQSKPSASARAHSSNRSSIVHSCGPLWIPNCVTPPPSAANAPVVVPSGGTYRVHSYRTKGSGHQRRLVTLGASPRDEEFDPMLDPRHRFLIDFCVP